MVKIPDTDIDGCPQRVPDVYKRQVHSWLKYPKFGHAAATDYTARYIRYGMLTREEAIPIIKARDGKLDPVSYTHLYDARHPARYHL